MKTYCGSRNGFLFFLLFLIFEVGFSSDAYSDGMADDHKGHKMISPSEMGSMDHGNAKMSDNMGHSMTMGKSMEMKRPVRIEEGKVYSPPPPLMGKQMGMVETLNVPALGYELDGKVKVFTLIAQPMEHVITDGKPMDNSIIPAMHRFTGGMGHMLDMEQKGLVWGYNGSMPGPTIEATAGDTIRVILKNELPEPTSIHWHGLEVPNAEDGAAGVTEAATLPGETHVYEFTLFQSGTFMYHTGFNVMKQDALGLGGLVVIHPKDEKNRPDREFAIMLQEWTFPPGNPNPNLASMAFNWFTFNGKSAPSIDIMRIKQGQRVRIRIGNLSMQSHPIHIHGYAWKVVGTEGGPIPESAQWSGATINVPPGTTRDVEFVAWNPGVWRFHCHRLHHIMNAMADRPMGIMPHGGMFTLVHVEPKDPKAKWIHPNQLEKMP